MLFSDNEIIALLFGTSLSEPRGMYAFLQLVPAVNQKRSATNSGDGCPPGQCFFIAVLTVEMEPSTHERATPPLNSFTSASESLEVWRGNRPQTVRRRTP